MSTNPHTRSPEPAPHSARQILPFRQSLLAVLGLSFVVMMVAIDQTVVSTALPTIVAELKGFDLYAWVATSYLLMSIITVPVFGRLGDHYGRKPFVIAAIVLFTLASALCGIADSMLFLVLARALQGIGGGMLVGTVFACIPDLFPDAHTRLRWQVILSSGFGIANAIGPSMGGFLTHAYGWRSVFYVNLPVGLISLWFVISYLPRIRHGEQRPMRVDWQGALLIALALGSLQLLLELAPADGLTAGIVALGALCAAAFALLVWWERRCKQPILPLDMFRDPKLSGLFVLAALTGFSMFAMLFYAPLMLQGGFGMSPKDAGLLITPLVVFITVGSIINGRIITRVPAPNVMLYAGFVSISLSFAGVALSHITTPHWLIATFMMLGGLGLGFVMPNLTVFAQETASRTRLGIVTALLQSLRMIGGLVGTALVGTLVNHLYVNGVKQALARADATRWQSLLSSPQILVNKDAQATFLEQAGQNGHMLVEAARESLVAAIHVGQFIGIAVVLFALWRVRAVPRIRFKHRGVPVKPDAQ